jgi:outer membrane lipoprotein SlyB
MKPSILRSALLAGSVSILAFGSGCQNAGPNTQQGAATGAIAGALLGAVIGHQSGEAGAGAALGAAAGAVAGGAIGSSQDQREAERRAQARETARLRTERERAEVELARQRQIVAGKSIEDPDLLAARQRAEAAEAELNRIRREEQDAIERARKLAEFQQREAEARREIDRMQGRAPSGG